jgi:23S rRNA (guanosine2251-2'-O)-methyltransferase
MASFIYGINPVLELLRARPRQIKEILISRKEQGLEQLVQTAKNAGAKINFVSKDQIDQVTGSREHQGIAADAPLPSSASFEDILEKVANNPSALLLFLDQIEDPQNLGAIIRSAECAKADAVIIPEHRSAGITPAMHKASAGALEWVPLAIVTNLARSLEQVKQAGFWSYAAVASAEKNIWQTEFEKKSALVVGSEGKGIRPLVQKTCDFTVSIPLFGKVGSLNASVSAAIILFECRRQSSSSQVST